MIRRARSALPLLALVLTACGGGEPPAAPAWSPVFEDLDRVLLSAWGPSLDALWAAGGPLGSPGEALILERTAEGFREHPAGTNRTLWWVWGAGPEDVFFVGEEGTILRWDGADVSSMESPTSATLFGVWGSAPNDVWAVGGDPFGAGELDVLLHYDGAAWSRVALPDPPGVALFKVWGSSAEDVWVVGQRGTLLRYDGASWTRQDAGTTVPLFTVSGTGPSDIWAVGGAPATLLHYDGESWTRLENPGLAATLSGVAAAADGSVLVVGGNGVKWRRTPEGQWLDEFDQPPYLDLHGAWLAPDGSEGVAVGGNYNAPSSSRRAGVLAHWGTDPPEAQIAR